MNIEKKTLEKVDVLYDDKKWGKRIDPDEWNANFKALENAHNKLVDSLTEQVDIVDEAFSNVTTEGGNNIHVDYSGGDFTLQQALDHVVNDINNRYTKLQSDTLLAENTNVLIRDISYNSQTGTFTITKKDGSVITIDTVIEKIPASMFLKEESDGSVWLVVTNQDGSQTKTNVTSLIEDTVINSSDTINVSSSTDSVNKVTTYILSIKPNSIGLAHVDSELTTKFEETQNAKILAVQAKDLAVSAKNNAETYASNANTYSVNSNKSATESANSALEAKRYAEQASSYKSSAEAAKIAAEKARDEAESIVGGDVLPSVTAGDSGKVLTVNEAGEWQAGIVQSDWNVNNASSSEYVKNRPFYTGNLVETYIVQNASLTYAGVEGTMKLYTFPSFFNLVEGTTYKVYFNGIVYECVCSVLQGPVSCIGNRSIPQVGDDTGEPFLIFTDNSSQSGVYTTYTSDTPSVSISTMVPEIVKIDEKYLPVATDDSYGAVKTSNLVYAYNFPVPVNPPDMIEAIEQFNKGKAVINWSGRLVEYARYDSSDSSIYISFAYEPFVVYRYEITPDSHEYVETLAQHYSIGSFEVDQILFTKKDSSGTSYINYCLDVNDGVLEFRNTPIAYKHSFKKTWLEASKWDSTSRTYSFESTYPNANYDIEVDIDGDRCTDEQLDAWIASKPLSSSTNKIVAKGDTPVVDIPIILTVTPK